MHSGISSTARNLPQMHRFMACQHSHLFIFILTNAKYIEDMTKSWPTSIFLMRYIRRSLK